MTQCACGYRDPVRFHDGRVAWYGHDWEPTPLQDWGTYRKVGWNTFEWSDPKHPPATVKVGWILSSYSGAFSQSNEVFYCWRYPFCWRANKLYRECEALTATKVKKGKP
jgi:hypothetical protein